MNLIAFDPHGTTGDGDVGVADPFPRPDVEFPAVPGAFYDRVGEVALSERPSSMGTAIVDGEEGSLHVKQGNPYPLDFHGLAGTGRDVFDFGDGDECVRRFCSHNEERLVQRVVRTAPGLISRAAYGIHITERTPDR